MLHVSPRARDLPNLSTPVAPNHLYFGDNLHVMRTYIADASVDLIYLDPPFKSNQDYNVLFAEQDGSRSAAQIKAFEDTWRWDQAAAEAYEEVVESGGRVSLAMQAFRTFLGETDMLAYLAMMAPRLMELRRVLKPTGSLYLHCDPTASHYLKMMMDAVFGPANFRNEIVWRRTNAHNDPKRYDRIHDIVFLYQKQPGAYFMPHFTPLPRGHVDERFDKQDGRGVYKLENPTGPGIRYGDSGEPWQEFNPTPRNRHWAPPRKVCETLGIDNDQPTRVKLDALLAADWIQLPKTPGHIPMIKAYFDQGNDQGTAYQDLWTYQSYTQGYYHGNAKSGIDQDVGWIGPTSGERLCYQTQKPEGLLERIIRCSCPDGEIILDLFCG
jgi:DNA modification methylase